MSKDGGGMVVALEKLIKLWPFHNMEIGRIDEFIYIYLVDEMGYLFYGRIRVGWAIDWDFESVWQD